MVLPRHRRRRACIEISIQERPVDEMVRPRCHAALDARGDEGHEAQEGRLPDQVIEGPATRTPSRHGQIRSCAITTCRPELVGSVTLRRFSGTTLGACRDCSKITAPN